jgi:hypothetical protein
MIQKFLQVLTWKKLLQLFLFLFIISLSWATYENREVIYGFANQKRIDPSSPHVHELSKNTTNEIDAIVERSELIVGIQVILADFQKNQRIVIYSSIDSDNPELKKIYSKFANSSIGNVPLFSDNVDDNRHLVALINGEFACRPFLETLSGRMAVEAGQYIKFSCSNGIPASYGRFTGVIVVYLKRQAHAEEYDQIRSVTKVLSTTIFDRDLNK